MILIILYKIIKKYQTVKKSSQREHSLYCPYWSCTEYQERKNGPTRR
jgi:hypothetical protein